MKLMGLLLTLPIVTPEVIAQRLGLDIEVRVAMNRLRKDLAKHGLVIESRRKLGYWFTDETKAKIKLMTDETNNVTLGLPLPVKVTS
jgi:hypothetical protein